MSALDAKGKAEGDTKSQAKGPPAEVKESGGGFKAWLPLVVTIVLMPVLAFVTTNFLVLPKIVHARGLDSHADSEEAAPAEHGENAVKDSESHGASKKEGEPKKDGKSAGKKKQTVQISKVIVNVAGSMGTRYLMTSFTLVGTQHEFKELIEENKDQLLDLANTSLASKTIGDLEKPGARNQIRAELISIFNNALGGAVVQEIFFTEFAIQ